MGKAMVKARRYRIFQLSTFDCLTNEERVLYDSYYECSDKAVRAERKHLFYRELQSYSGVRCIPDSRLKVKNTDGTLSDEYKESIQNPMFEGEMARLATDFREEFPLVKEIVYMECPILEILKQIIENGVMIEEGKYIFYSATTNMMKKKMVILLKESFFKTNEAKIMCGLSRDIINNGNDRVKGCNRGKYLAYTSLPMSTSVEVSSLNIGDEKYGIDIDKCVVVPDFECVVHDKVNYLDVNTLESEIKDMDIPIPYMDGAGIYLPSSGIMPRTGQIRGGFFKGCLFPFDFRGFIASQKDSNPEIVDVYGDKVDILEKDIKVIFTASQFKMWKYYDNWEAFKKAFRENGCKICVNNLAHEPQDNAVTTLTYQFLQTLPKDKLTDENIAKLCEKTVDKLTKAKTDKDVALELIGISGDKELKPLYAALIVYPELINDDAIKKMITEKVNAIRHNAMGGKIMVDGFYSYICPDLYAFCEELFYGVKNPKGLIPRNEVYNSYYNNADVDKVVCLRSPHLGDSEHCVRQLTKSDECKKWFSGYDTVISNHDLISKRLMCDFDGDEMLVTSSKTLIDVIDEDKTTLYYDMQKANAEQITDEVLYDCLISSFENSIIGNISNALTKLYSVNGNPAYEFIRILTAYNNYMIDYPKTQKAMDLGVYTEEYEHLTDKIHKLPYFFIYAKGKSKSSVAEATDCNVDRICKHISKNVKNTKWEIFADDAINPQILCNPNIKIYRTSKKYEELVKLLGQLHYNAQSTQIYSKRVKQKFMESNGGIDKDILRTDFHYYLCRMAIAGIFQKNYNKAASYLVDAEYYQDEFRPCNKKFIWNCFGVEIVDNIMKNVNSDRTMKIKRRQYNTKKKIELSNTVAEANKEIEEQAESKTVDITDKELSWIEGIKFRKNCQTDRLLLFILLYLHKRYSKDGRFRLYSNTKSGITASTIDNWIGSDICKKGIVRLEKKGILGSESVSNRYGKYMSISVNVPKFEDENVIISINGGNPLVGLYEYNGERKVKQCEICGKKFPSIGNQKTCGSLLCKRRLEKRTKDKCNERARVN